MTTVRPSISDADALAERLRSASQSYYHDGESIMSDAEYDDGIATLSESYPERYADLLDSHVGNGVSMDASDTITHEIPMLSLAKAYTMGDVQAYITRTVKAGATGFRLQPKLDGMSLSAVYTNGALSSLSSRGNGEVGRNLTYLIGNPDVTINGLPMRIGSRGIVEVRGELLLRHSDFTIASRAREKATGTPFETYRNANAGIVNGARLGLGYHATLTFVSYRLIINGVPHDDEPSELDDMGFTSAESSLRESWPTAPSMVVNDTRTALEDITGIIDEYGRVRESFDIPNDGIVIKPVNEDEMNDIMGATAHHPSSQLAFKYRGDRVIATVRSLEWSVGKQGHLTPTLVYDPLELDGTRNDRATFHNASFVMEYDIAPGSHVIIERAGQVIPKFVDVIDTPSGAARFTVPKSCPACGSTITMNGRFAVCGNAECPGRRSLFLESVVSSHILDIKGMGPSIIAALRERGVDDIPSLLSLTVDDLSSLRTGDDGRVVGASMAARIHESIIKARSLPVERIIAALGINGVGVRMGKALSKAGYGTIESMANATYDELVMVPGIGGVMADSMVSWFHAHPTITEELDDAGVLTARHSTVVDPTDGNGSITGLTFSITGSVPDGFRNRDEFIDHIESHGGMFTARPGRGTDVLIGDPASSSSKMVRARSLGIRIIDPKDFHRIFG